MLKELGVNLIPHPAYSPDLSPTDYHVFQALELYIHQKVHLDEISLENDFPEFLNSCGQDFYPSGMNSPAERWKKCVLSSGAYFN
ncbi:hypothetical protein M514_12212 [Trichuris suis]|uniref:Histone-lysine N-methyltransferase SETMAR n=1 Tax=Trichuris suis TaxID=68888 RepID=A0A085LPM6_9BILA|nr:hypothetical protein M513_12212 [Trichuris suis]KFD64239.1 hypothetical protein M514_12212 [Trichuris suis]